MDINERVFDASAGSYYTLIILSDRSAAVAGYIENLDEYQGHFGLERQGLRVGVNQERTITNVENSMGQRVPAPEFMKVYAGAENIEGSGRMHSVFIDIDGNAYSSGNNNNGQLCLSNFESRDIPRRFFLPNNEKATSAAVGVEFTLILSDTGKVYSCGNNEFGQLGLGSDVQSRNLPSEIIGLSGVERISAGRDSSLFGIVGNRLYVTGRNNYGAYIRYFAYLMLGPSLPSEIHESLPAAFSFCRPTLR